MKQNPLYIAFFLFPLLLTSCIPQAAPAVTVPVPHWPPSQSSIQKEYPPLEAWKVTVTCGTSTSCFFVQPSQTSVSFAPQDPFPTAVVFLPVTYGKFFFKPAGLVYPYQSSPDWLSGFAAFVLQSYYLSNSQLNSDISLKTSASRFNWNHFLQVIAQKQQSSKLFYNPWNLDSTEIIKELSEKSFSATLLTQKKCFQIDESEIYQKIQEKPFFSDYIPQNNCQKITLKSDSTSCFLLFDTNPSIITVTSTSSSGFSLAINSFPH